MHAHKCRMYGNLLWESRSYVPYIRPNVSSSSGLPSHHTFVNEHSVQRALVLTLPYLHHITSGHFHRHFVRTPWFPSTKIVLLSQLTLQVGNFAYMGGVNPGVNGSVCFVLEFAFLPFLPLSPLECKFKNKTGTEPLTQ